MGLTAIMLVFPIVAAASMADEYDYVPNSSQWVELRRGETRSIGKLDAAGNFVPDRRFLNVRGDLSSSPPSRPMGRGVKERVYEYRSGRLIIGTIDEKDNFLPDLGSKVTFFKDYHYTKNAPRIYNLPGYFIKKGAQEEKDKEQVHRGFSGRGDLAGERSHIVLVLSCMLVGGMAEEYDYVPDTKRHVALRRGDTYSIGKLDAAGNFLYDNDRWLDVTDKPSDAPDFEFLNASGLDKEQVYEYRSKRLIKGILDKEGNFVPELDSKVTSFKDYQYSKSTPRIYNLPGVFKKKGSKEEKQKEE